MKAPGLTTSRSGRCEYDSVDGGGAGMTVPAYQPLRSRNQPGVRLPTDNVDGDTARAWLAHGDRAQRRAAMRWLRRRQDQLAQTGARPCRQK